MEWSFLLVAVCFFGSISGCPENFVFVDNVCVTQFVDFSRRAEHEHASEFCGRFNPKGYNGLLWTIDEIDTLNAKVINNILSPDKFLLENSFPFWSGEVIPQTDTCGIVDKSGDKLELRELNCNHSLPFVCAIQRQAEHCQDVLDDAFCEEHSNVFCNTTGHLATLCPKTCGLCEKLESCSNDMDQWQSYSCVQLADRGLCNSESNNINSFCQLSCCMHTHDVTMSIGNPDLVTALYNGCEDNLVDARVDCSVGLSVDKCNIDQHFTSQCLQTCCRYTSSIREIALEKMRGKDDFQKRYQSWETDITRHHCVSKYDDTWPPYCKMEDRCSSKKRQFCEVTCCLEENGLAPAGTVTVHTTTTSPGSSSSESTTSSSSTTTTTTPACDAQDNEYGDVCYTVVLDVSICFMDATIAANCKLTCCQLGFQTTISTTTTHTNTPYCDQFSNTARNKLCDQITELEDCFKPKYYGKCDYTCCDNFIGFTTTSSTTTTTVECSAFVETKKKCVNINSADDCGNDWAVDCPATCCEYGVFFGSSSAVSTTTVVSCTGLTNRMDKCHKLKELDECLLKDNIDECDLKCCELARDAQITSTTSSATETVSTQCDDLKDRFEKCDKIADEQSCEFSVGPLCQRTCCKIGYVAPSGSTDEPADDKTECLDLKDRFEKCGRIADELTCLTSAGDVCEQTCCLLGFPTTGASTSASPTPVDICADYTDTSVKCAWLYFEEDPVLSCITVDIYRDTCHQSCCLVNSHFSSHSTSAEPDVCNEYEDRQDNCGAMNLNEDKCSYPTFKYHCKRSCCQVTGGILLSTTSFSTTTTTTSSTTSFSTGVDACEDKCTEPDIEDQEFCARVVRSHVDNDLPAELQNLCDDLKLFHLCQFSCCIYNDVTGFSDAVSLSPYDDSTCSSESDDAQLTYNECYLRHLTRSCEDVCDYTCCLLEELAVPVNPGCYGKSDDPDYNCLAKCITLDSCEDNDECPEYCSFSCCVLQNIEDRTTTTSLSPPTTSGSDCEKQVSTSNSCKGTLNYDPTNCEPSESLYDVNGCSKHCCYLGVSLLLSSSTTVSATTP